MVWKRKTDIRGLKLIEIQVGTYDLWLLSFATLIFSTAVFIFDIALIRIGPQSTLILRF